MPKCLIVGFAKCGTYALKSFLSLHPSIVCAENETQFFSRFYHKGFDWYKQQMPLSSEHQITLEKTPSYVESKLALRRIHAFNSSMKLIVIVRNPVIRLQSSYAHFMSKNKNRKMNITFKEWCGDNKSIAQRMDLSSYFVDIYSLFRRDQVLVLSEEDLEVDPLRVMQEVETFIGLNHSFTKGIFVFNFKKGFFCFNTSNSKFRDISSEIKVDPITVESCPFLTPLSFDDPYMSGRPCQSTPLSSFFDVLVLCSGHLAKLDDSTLCCCYRFSSSLVIPGRGNRFYLSMEAENEP
ncbi:hypothetical protein RRG08_010468 [Elysia crispata]|uniref:Sulfotransferase domain-containing protein n=1 Tax=Elysia crispata TaxID=231223 RepID=A0AAE1ANK4_9GAST|nr:hypothetical protein RRG08_010468 [Elysia crispata]